MSGGYATIRRMNQFDLIAFDADDTLWHSESAYVAVHESFLKLLAPYGIEADILKTLDETEERNLVYYGYGAKSFILSLIETTIHLTGGKVAPADIEKLLDMGKKMLTAEVELLEHVNETLASLSKRYALMVITKGDSFHQESKVKQSGLKPYFRYVEILSDKTPEVYADLLSHYQVNPERFLMVGNSIRSDILPVVAIGGRAVHIPYHITWTHEHVHITQEQRNGFFELEDISLLPELLEKLEQRS